MSDKIRPKLLFISPVMPALGGHGTAMRAGMFLEAYAKKHEVFLLVAPLFQAKGSIDFVVPNFVSQCASQVAIEPLARDGDPSAEVLASMKSLSEWRGATIDFVVSRLRDPVKRAELRRQEEMPFLCRFGHGANVDRALARFAGIDFDLVHVERLYLAAFAEPFLSKTGGGRPICILDLDDDESQTRLRFSRLHAAVGNKLLADLEAGESRKFSRFEQDYLPRYDRVIVCSELDCRTVSLRLALDNVSVVPNAVRVPDIEDDDSFNYPDSSKTTERDLVFIGTLAYYPNVDAANFLCRDILPIMHKRLGRQPTALIAGGNPLPEAVSLGRLGGVEVIANPPDVAPLYQAATIAVAPLRAGGGTRIKILEALAFRKPVVSTSLGAEGLEARPNTHLLIADSAEDFADSCCRLLENRKLAKDLSRRGHRLVQSFYSLPAVSAQIDSMLSRLS